MTMGGFMGNYKNLDQEYKKYLLHINSNPDTGNPNSGVHSNTSFWF